MTKTDRTPKDFKALTDAELLLEKKKLKQSKIFHAVFIGFLTGVSIFGIVSWSLSSERQLGFLIPMLIPIGLIYKLMKTPKKHAELETELKERHLN